MTNSDTDAELVSNDHSNASEHYHLAAVNQLTPGTEAHSFHQTSDKENMKEVVTTKEVDLFELIDSLNRPGPGYEEAKIPLGDDISSAPTDAAERGTIVDGHENEPSARELEVSAPSAGSVTEANEELTAAEDEKSKAQLSETDLDRVVDSMNQRFAWLTIPMSVCRIEDGSSCKMETLRAHFANTRTEMQVGTTIKVMNHFDAWLKSPRRREHLDIDFVPGGPRVVNNHVNLWKNWGAEPVAGNVQPWTDMMDYIFAGSPGERKWAEQWFA